MKINAEVMVTGAKCWKAPNKETGELVDSGTFFIETAVKNSSKESYGANDAGWSGGVMTIPYKCTNSGVVRRVKGIPFPYKAQVTVEQETDGEQIFQVVLDLKPMPENLKPGQITKAA